MRLSYKELNKLDPEVLEKVLSFEYRCFFGGREEVIEDWVELFGWSIGTSCRRLTSTSYLFNLVGLSVEFALCCFSNTYSCPFYSFYSKKISLWLECLLPVW